jgi:hypothetical protein
LKFAFSLFKNTFPKFLTFSKVTPTSEIKKFARIITMKNILKYHTIQIIAIANGWALAKSELLSYETPSSRMVCSVFESLSFQAP